MCKPLGANILGPLHMPHSTILAGPNDGNRRLLALLADH